MPCPALALIARCCFATFVTSTALSCGGHSSATVAVGPTYLTDVQALTDQFTKSYERLVALLRQPDFTAPWRSSVADEVLRQRDLSDQWRQLRPSPQSEVAHRKSLEALDAFDESGRLVLEAANERDFDKLGQAGRLSAQGGRLLEEARLLLPK